jgi:hypothetical protein
MVADQNLSFEFPTSDTFQAYAHFMRPDAAKHLPSSSTTLRAWILEAYKAHKEVMIEVLHAAPGLVHITADVWTAPNDIALLGSDLPTVQTSSKIMFRRGLKTVRIGTQMCEI